LVIWSSWLTITIGSVSSLTGAMLECVRPSNGIYLTLDDVRGHAQVHDDVHTCPTRVISLENTLNGMLMPLSEVQRISKWAGEHGIKMHLDGARLWEVAASGAGSIREYAECFDTLTLCFSKGLGAPIGSILLGTKALIKQARWVRKTIGGGLRQSGVVAAAARVAVDETFGSDPNGRDGLLGKSHEMAAQVAKMWTALGGKLTYPPHTNMVWLDLEDAGCSDARIAELGRQQGLRLRGGRIICHYQSYQNADVVIPRLEAIFKTIMADKGQGAKASGGNGGDNALYK
jgi:threonine aldolase